MKGPLTAEKLYYISALVFFVGFVYTTVLNYALPIPVDPAAIATDQFNNALNWLAWVLPIAGSLTFILGFFAGRK